MTDEIPLGPTPAGWSDDLLAQYIDSWRRNQLATFQQKSGAYRRLRDVDALFLRLADNLDNTDQTAPALFFYRAHAAYRAAVGLAMAGQIVEVFAVLRNCLEQGLYAYFIFKSPDRYDVWSERHESPEALKAVRRLFVVTDMLATVAADHPDDGIVARALYEAMIDWGAHPNTHGLMQAVDLEHAAGSVEIITQYLHPDTEQHDGALKDTARVGACVLAIFGRIFEPRFTILRLWDALTAVRNGL